MQSDRHQYERKQWSWIVYTKGVKEPSHLVQWISYSHPGLLRDSPQLETKRHHFPNLLPLGQDNPMLCVLYWLPELPGRLHSSWPQWPRSWWCAFVFQSLIYISTSPQFERSSLSSDHNSESALGNPVKAIQGLRFPYSWHFFQPQQHKRTDQALCISLRGYKLLSACAFTESCLWKSPSWQVKTTQKKSEDSLTKAGVFVF